MEGLIVSVKKLGWDWKIIYINSDNKLTSFDTDVSGKIKWDEKVGHRFVLAPFSDACFSESRHEIPASITIEEDKIVFTDNIQITDIKNGKILFPYSYCGFDCVGSFDLKTASILNPERIAPGSRLYKCRFGCNVPNINMALHKRGWMLQKCPRTGGECNQAHWQVLDESEIASLEILETRNNVRPRRKSIKYPTKIASPRCGAKRFTAETVARVEYAKKMRTKEY